MRPSNVQGGLSLNFGLIWMAEHEVGSCKVLACACARAASRLALAPAWRPSRTSCLYAWPLHDVERSHIGALAYRSTPVPRAV